MNFISDFFGKYDERSETIERAAGDLAFKLLWVLTLISLMLIAVLVENGLDSWDLASTIAIAQIAALLISLFVKYYFCWINNIARGRIIAKFATAVVAGTAIVLVLLNFLIA